MVRLFGLSGNSSKRDDCDDHNISRAKESSVKLGIEPDIKRAELGGDRNASLYDDCVSSEEPSTRSSSLFSKSRYTHGSSSISSRSDEDYPKNMDNIGKPLRVIDYRKFSSLNTVSEENTIESEARTEEEKRGIRSSRTLRIEQVEKELLGLEESLAGLVDDIHQSVTNISKAVIEAIEFFKEFLPNFHDNLPFRMYIEKNSSLRAIAKITLHFLDNLLASEVFDNSKSMLMKRYMQFLKKLNISMDNDQNLQSLPYMTNFCIDADCNLPRRDTISKIVNEISKQDSSLIIDREGAFIAPILRGLSKKSAILAVMFGVPELHQEHYEIVNALYSIFPDVHFFCAKDYIKPGAADLLHFQMAPMEFSLPRTPMIASFIPPYRLAADAFEPPISMSLSSQHSLKNTGTLGGYLFPRIQGDVSLSQFEGASFAVTCSHVVLAENHDHPHVFMPSKVLQKSYMNTLLEESQRYPKESQESQAFQREVARVEGHLKWQEENKFGQVIWGERSIIDHKLSDFAIIKVNDRFKCKNCLGGDLSTIRDPTLRFQNMYVKEKTLKCRPGLEVFKIGASSNYTSGQVNAAKLVYWADGLLQSSEFVVSSPLPLFATAGDSGSWILTKLENRPGLSCVGMLHSYDGEQKQFGLFTPIGDILERLRAVTGVLWDIQN